MSTNTRHNNSTGFTTPKDYFSSFNENLFEKLHPNSTDIEDTGFSIPNGYFESFDDELFSKIHTENSSFSTTKETGYTSPKGYLDNIDYIITNTVNRHKTTKVIPLFTRGQIIKVASIAAIAVLSFFVVTFFFNDSNPISFEDIDYATYEEYINEEDLSLNEYEIADLYNVTEDDLESLETILDNEQLYEYLSDELTTDDYIDSL